MVDRLQIKSDQDTADTAKYKERTITDFTKRTERISQDLKDVFREMRMA
jgi:hypothetical protein